MKDSSFHQSYIGVLVDIAALRRAAAVTRAMGVLGDLEALRRTAR